MSSLTIKVGSSKKASITPLIKGINETHCQILLDLENSVIVIENFSNSTIDDIIKLVDDYYRILRVDINTDTLCFDSEVDTESQYSTSVTIVNEQSPASSSMFSMKNELLNVIGFALDKLDTSKNLEEQVETFLSDIQMTTSNIIVKQAFIVACSVKKINYTNICHEIKESLPKSNYDESQINKILKKKFNNWLKKYPSLEEKHLYFTALLKIFAKKFEAV